MPVKFFLFFLLINCHFLAIFSWVATSRCFRRCYTQRVYIIKETKFFNRFQTFRMRFYYMSMEEHDSNRKFHFFFLSDRSGCNYNNWYSPITALLIKTYLKVWSRWDSNWKTSSLLMIASSKPATCQNRQITRVRKK